MFGHYPAECPPEKAHASAKRALWGKELAPNMAASHAEPTRQFSLAGRPTSDIQADNILVELKAKNLHAEFLLVKATIAFVNSFETNFNEKTTSLIRQLDEYKEKYGESYGVYAYCINYLSSHMLNRALDTHFAIFYQNCELKKYLDTNKHQAAHSPQRHNCSPGGSPTKG